MKNLLLVMVGGGIGAGLRYGAALLLQGFSPLLFPWSTIAVNIAGSIAIGFLWGTYQESQWFAEWGRLMLVVGICGGFTTFSAFSYEAYIYLLDGRVLLSAIYAVASVVFCVLGVWMGHRLSAGV